MGWAAARRAAGVAVRTAALVSPAELAVWLVALIAVLGFLGSREIDGVRERRLAGSAADILEHGRWLVPQLQGAPRFLKPLLADWSAAVSMRLFGCNERAFRLPFALSALGTVALARLFAGRLLGAGGGRAAALILATTPYFVSEAHSASTDLLLVFFSGAAMVAWWFWQSAPVPGSPLWCVFYVALGLGCLAKGPVALAIAAIPIGLELWASRRWELALRMRPWWGLLIVLAMAVPWPIAVCFVIPNAPTRWLADMNLSLTREHSSNVSEYLGYVSHIGNWSYFCFPWTVFGVAALGLPLLRVRLGPLWPELRFVYFWLIGNLAFFSTWAMQPMHYLLPVALPLAVIEAFFWHQLLAAAGRAPHAVRLIQAGFALSFLALALVTAGMMQQRAATPMLVALAVGGVLAVLGVLGAARLADRPRQSFVLLVLAGLIAVSIFSGWIRPRMSRRGSCARFATELAARVPVGAPVLFVEIEEAVPFYARRDFRKVATAALPERMGTLGRGYVLVTRATYGALRATAPPHTELRVLLEADNHKDPREDLVLLAFGPGGT